MNSASRSFQKNHKKLHHQTQGVFDRWMMPIATEQSITQHTSSSVSDVFFSKSSPVWEHQWEWKDCFPQQGLMMPDGLFSRPVPALKADHYRALDSFSAKAVALKMSCHQHEEGMQRAGHYSDPAHSECRYFGRLGRSAVWSKKQYFEDLVNDGLCAGECKPQVKFIEAKK